VVRVSRDGYRSWEGGIDVAVGQTVRVTARLEPLAIAGRVRVEKPEGAELVVDDAPVGLVPWEGALEPGTHRFQLRMGDQGSGPRTIVVVKGQTVLAVAELSALGPEQRILTTPPTAELSLDDVVVGKGRWQGRLPVGRHQLLAREEGYLDESRTVDVTTATTGADVALQLRVDQSHPRWATGDDAGAFWAELFGGLVMAPSFASGGEQGCDAAATCPDDPLALGFLAGARGGYELPFGLSIELAAGYLRATKSMRREETIAQSGFPDGLGYGLDHDMTVSSGFAGAGVGYRLPFAEVLELRAHLVLGALFGTWRDTVSGAVAAGGATDPLLVEPPTVEKFAGTLLLLPELGLGARFGGVGVALGFAAGIVPLEGPSYPAAVSQPAGWASCAATPDPRCAPKRELGGRTFGPMVLLVPEVGVSYIF
jgi:hypothetical protein